MLLCLYGKKGKQTLFKNSHREIDRDSLSKLYKAAQGATTLDVALSNLQLAVITPLPEDVSRHHSRDILQREEAFLEDDQEKPIAFP